ncbi:MAG: prepilin-type N-terminal cleavage/methylation domain-containing protein [Nitrosomonadales bacterium]|nr:prepilin-type N-terminal cleavage/methylation domain-containing protein [Nitrosomonadales bacterium]
MSTTVNAAVTCKFRQRGFTLVELVTVIVILGVVSAVVLPRFFDNDVFESRAAADRVKSALRYGQKLAIAAHAPVTVSISAAADPECGTEVAGGVLGCQIEDGVTVNRTLPWTVTFDAMGRPGAADSITVGTTAISIAAETGYVSYVQ